MKKIKSVLLLMFFGIVTLSHAEMIDFRSVPFQLANGSYSFYYEAENLTITALPGGAKLYQDAIDGLGVNNSGSYEWDEIEGLEFLHLHFKTSYNLNEILVTDLFYEPYAYGGEYFSEIGYYSFDNIDWIAFAAPESNLPSPITNGELLLSFS